MFNTREEMIEMYVTVMDKNQWKYVLVTSEMTSDDLTTKEVTSLLSQWSSMISAHLHTSDAAYQINPGNILILLHEENEKRFQQYMEQGFISSTKTKEGILSSILHLTKKEISFLLSIQD
jgi:hypothetical protein